MPQRRGDRDAGPGRRVTRPDGSRRMTTTPASAVRVSRSPPCQPSAPVTVRSATRPERSTWASPYTTSRPSAGGRTGGTVSGRVRAAAGRAGGTGRGRRGDERGDQRAGHGCLPRREAGPVSAVGRPQASARASACSSGALKRVMYHHSGCPRGDLNTETGAVSLDRGNRPAGNTRLSIDRGSQITTIISFEISVVPPKPRRTADDAKSGPLRPGPLPDDGTRR